MFTQYHIFVSENIYTQVKLLCRSECFIYIFNVCMIMIKEEWPLEGERVMGEFRGREMKGKMS